MTTRSDHEMLKQLFAAAVDAAAPDRALTRHVRLEGSSLLVGSRRWEAARCRVFVLGAGKGAAPMAQAAENLLGDSLTEGLVVVKYGHALPLKRIALLEAAHPVPDAAGAEAAARLLEMAREAKKDELVLCLLTGGASALTSVPAPELTLDDLQRVTEMLLCCGATIGEINAFRKHLSLFGGGQLARAASPAHIVGLIISDVVGDPLDVIASGPTCPDPSTFRDCVELMNRYQLEPRLPEGVVRRLKRGAAGEIPETPKAGDPVFDTVENILIAGNRQSLEAAARAAEERGFESRILTCSMEGEARLTAAELVAKALDVRKGMAPGARPVCLLAGGETTVTIRGGGLGGRNQEMALAAALELEGHEGVSALFAGTDGTDGPTDAAGGVADEEAVAAMGGREKALAWLEENDSHTALSAGGRLFVSGPTRTNVMDVAILLVHPPQR